jgi:hypothetical protein
MNKTVVLAAALAVAWTGAEANLGAAPAPSDYTNRVVTIVKT